MTYILMHSGIKGQKWGNRRFQYEDGSLTPEGRLRYRDSSGKVKSAIKTYTKALKISKKAQEDEVDFKKTRKGSLSRAGYLGNAVTRREKQNSLNRKFDKKMNKMSTYEQKEVKDFISKMNKQSISSLTPAQYKAGANYINSLNTATYAGTFVGGIPGGLAANTVANLYYRNKLKSI